MGFGFGSVFEEQNIASALVVSESGQFVKATAEILDFMLNKKKMHGIYLKSLSNSRLESHLAMKGVSMSNLLVIYVNNQKLADLAISIDQSLRHFIDKDKFIFVDSVLNLPGNSQAEKLKFAKFLAKLSSSYNSSQIFFSTGNSKVVSSLSGWCDATIKLSDKKW